MRRVTWSKASPRSIRSRRTASFGHSWSSTQAPRWPVIRTQPSALDQVHAFEAAHGRIPDGAAVFLRTGWEAFNTDPARFANVPGPLRFPGFGPDAARFLVEERAVAGLGVDTLGIDPGVATDFPVHRQISHPRGVWHVEGLMNLAGLPPLGAWVVVGVLNLVDGSGSPARVLALVP